MYLLFEMRKLMSTREYLLLNYVKTAGGIKMKFATGVDYIIYTEIQAKLLAEDNYLYK